MEIAVAPRLEGPDPPVRIREASFAVSAIEARDFVAPLPNAPRGALAKPGGAAFHEPQVEEAGRGRSSGSPSGDETDDDAPRNGSLGEAGTNLGLNLVANALWSFLTWA